MRLQKYLAQLGVASRRKCEEFIKEGWIKVNGEVVTQMGVTIDPERDTIETAPHITLVQSQNVYYMIHKPVGYVTTVTGIEKPSIMELVKEIPERIFPVGRLDKLTSGLLLMTNDGRFTYEMTHPRFEKEKEYVVKVREKVTPEVLRQLAQPFFIHGKKTNPPVDISLQSPHLFRVILREGRNRQIRRMCERVDLHVEKLKRVRIGKLMLGELPTGAYRKLTSAEKELLRG